MKHETWSRLSALLRQFFLDALFPEFCLRCGVEGVVFCQHCVAAVPLQVLHGCPFCDRVSMMGKTCDACQSKTPLEGVFSFGLYSQPVFRELVWALKYHGKRDLGLILGTRVASMVGSVILSLSKDLVTTAVPLHPARRKSRGYNQSELIARSVAETLGVPYANLLERVRATPPQVEIHGVNDRLANVRNAFSVQRDVILSQAEGSRSAVAGRTSSLAGTSVLLVDDVVTTGATLTACARVLRRAGAARVYALTLARG